MRRNVPLSAFKSSLYSMWNCLLNSSGEGSPPFSGVHSPSETLYMRHRKPLRVQEPRALSDHLSGGSGCNQDKRILFGQLRGADRALRRFLVIGEVETKGGIFPLLSTAGSTRGWASAPRRGRWSLLNGARTPWLRPLLEGITASEDLLLDQRKELRGRHAGPLLESFLRFLGVRA